MWLIWRGLGKPPRARCHLVLSLSKMPVNTQPSGERERGGTEANVQDSLVSHWCPTGVLAGHTDRPLVDSLPVYAILEGRLPMSPSSHFRAAQPPALK
jgi:hypothetical protein